MVKAIFIILLSALLFSCKNENNQEVSTPEENIGSQEETNEITDEPQTIKDTIEVYQPQAGRTISSPLKIEGRARGFWYYEATFVIRLLDENEREIAFVQGEAQDSWMTRNWVNFSATLKFENPESEEGFLVFEKANPSGLEEYDRELRVPVKFKAP